MAAIDQAQEKRGSDDQATTAVTHAVLLKDLKPICAKWEAFGLNLGVPFDKLLTFRNNTSGRTALTEHCFNRVIDAWLTGNKANINKEFLADAIRGVGGFERLASKVDAMTFKKKPKAGPFLSLLGDMKAKYSILGVQLGVDLAKIRQFETLAGDAEDCLNQTIFYWIHSMTEDEDDDDDDDDEESNRETLLEALKTVGHARLAEELKEKYKDMEFPGDEKTSASIC